MSNSFKLYPTHISRGGENFSRGAKPLVTGLLLIREGSGETPLQAAVDLRKGRGSVGNVSCVKMCVKEKDKNKA